MDQDSVSKMTPAERQERGCWWRGGAPAVDHFHIQYQLDKSSKGCFLLMPGVVACKDSSVDEGLVRAAAREIPGCRLLKRKDDGAYIFTRCDDLVAGKGEAENLEEIFL